jgi:hypothetical protein
MNKQPLKRLGTAILPVKEKLTPMQQPKPTRAELPSASEMALKHPRFQLARPEESGKVFVFGVHPTLKKLPIRS